MKKPAILYFLLSFIILAGLLTLIFTSFPKNIDRTFEAVKYRLGAENADYMEKTSYMIKGKYSHSLFGHSFKGVIYENGEPISAFNNDDYDVTINFDETNQGLLYITGEYVSLISYGTIYIDQKFNQIAISLFEQAEDSAANEKTWNSADGLMIAGPAATREEALDISNELMKEVIHKPLE
ncbi:MAG: hypothetical protein JXQ23_05345 [Clostridia bacterium]|nr:hypothetical protein [Clostridia bacterium]